VLTLALVGCDVTLARGLPEHDAALIGAELNRHGIASNRIEETGQSGRARIDIAASEVPDAFAALRDPAPLWSKPAADDLAPSADLPLIATKRAERQRASDELGRRLASALESLPGVNRARVTIALPLSSDRLDDLTGVAAIPTPHASVLLVSAPDASGLRQRARELVAAAVPGLPAQEVEVIQQPLAAEEHGCSGLARLGPITLARASLPVFKLWVALSLSLHAALAATLLIVMARKRRPPP
jgi:type III secretory pathway lipoprotein EscJ